MGDAPTVNTSTWRLPKKGHSTPEASYTDEMYRAKGLPVDPDRAPTTGASGLPTVSTEEWVTPSTRARLEEQRGEKPSKVRHHAKSFEVDLDDEEFVDLGDDYDRGRFSDLEGGMDESGCGGKPKRSLLKRKTRRSAQEQAPVPQVESVQSVQRRLAGLERPRHLEFATGKPYRRMPSSMLQETGLDPIGEARVELGETEFDIPHEQAALSGLTERAPLPHPLHDTRPVSARRAHGILDDGKDGGEEFVDQVLEESRWFFRDFGDLALGAKKRPFDEAPGGRSGPWRGSEDEPAETPVVRHGKVKGMVGDDQEPEPEDAAAAG